MHVSYTSLAFASLLAQHAVASPQPLVNLRHRAPEYSPTCTDFTSAFSTELGPNPSSPPLETFPVTTDPLTTLIVSESVAVSTTSSPVTIAGTVSTPAPTVDTPPALPKCLNTYLHLTDCKDVADTSCYCKDSDFISKVMCCMDARSSSTAEANSAAAYLTGICAEYVASNPAFITACPKTSPLVASAAASTTTVILAGVTPAATSVHPSSVVSDITLATTHEGTVIKTSVFDSITTVSATVTPIAQPSVAFTTIIYSSTFIIAAAQVSTTGVSAALITPTRSITTLIHTTITAPRVQFSPVVVTVTGSTSAVSMVLVPQPPTTTTEVVGVTASVLAVTAPISKTTKHPHKFGPGGTSLSSNGSAASTFSVKFSPVPTTSPITPFHSDAGILTGPGLVAFVAGFLVAGFAFR